MLRRIVWIIIGVPLVLLVIGTGAAFSFPVTRHIITAFWNLPDRLPALADNGLVHYEPGAEEFARDVATLLPAAIARVEAAQGRAFARSVILGAYATPEVYAAANGTGSVGPVGVTFYGRINLSPKLSSLQRRRLPAILTHELSHAHLQGWIGNRILALPNWFKEGLAVMVSDGGGAELVNEEEARQAILRGEQIEINDAGSLLNLTEIRFAHPPAQQDPAWYPTVLAYREAGMFVSYLRESDRAAFERMIKDVLDGRTFADALRDAYHGDAKVLWAMFKASFART